TLMHYIANISFKDFRKELYRINESNKRMDYVREHGVHKAVKDKEWSPNLRLRDIALNFIELTFLQAAKTDDKWLKLCKE
ncbi:unnamed protein product, partial [Oikopleura dioica]